MEEIAHHLALLRRSVRPVLHPVHGVGEARDAGRRLEHHVGRLVRVQRHDLSGRERGAVATVAPASERSHAHHRIGVVVGGIPLSSSTWSTMSSRFTARASTIWPARRRESFSCRSWSAESSASWTPIDTNTPESVMKTASTAAKVMKRFWRRPSFSNNCSMSPDTPLAGCVEKHQEFGRFPAGHPTGRRGVKNAAALQATDRTGPASPPWAVGGRLRARLVLDLERLGDAVRSGLAGPDRSRDHDPAGAANSGCGRPLERGAHVGEPDWQRGVAAGLVARPSGVTFTS